MASRRADDSTTAPAVPGRIAQDDLNAFADGTLGPAEAAAIATHLKTHEEDAALVAEIRAINRLLRDGALAQADDPVPERLLRAAHDLADALAARRAARRRG